MSDEQEKQETAAAEETANTTESAVESKLPEGEAEVDLEKQRDERCIPIAYLLMEEMANNLMPDGSDLQQIDARPVALKGLEYFLAADLNIAQEASYVPQLILAALSGLNATVQQCDSIQPDDLRYAGIAKKILHILSDAKVPLVVSKDTKELDPAYEVVKTKINELFAEEKLTSLEVKYVMDGIFNSFTAVNNLMSSSLEQSSERAEARLFGVDSMGDLTMSKLDAVLKSAPIE